MHEHLSAFLESVSDAFRLRGPIYQFGYSPIADSAGGLALPGGCPEQGNPARQECESAEIDRLEDLVRLPYPDGTARTVIAVNTLEHVFEPRRVVEEMIRILAPGGMLLVSSASGAQLCQRPDCYWRPTPCAIGRLLSGLEATLIGWQGVRPHIHTSFGIAWKGPLPETFTAGVSRFLDCFQKRLDEAAVPRGWRQRISDLFTSARHPYRAQFVLHLPVREQLKHELLVGCLPEENPGTRLDTSQ